MRFPRRGAERGRPGRAAGLLVGLLLCCADASLGRAAEQDAPPTPAAGPSVPTACGTQAARYDDGAGFGLAVTRVGQVRVENPLRPLTPEVTRVLQVVIAGKVATAYGPDLTALRRGAAPGAIEAQIGGPIRWEVTLPALPDQIAIVGDDGGALARLAFRACEDPPAVSAPPQAKRSKPPGKPRGAPEGRAAGKVPPGFSLPQGAIAE